MLDVIRYTRFDVSLRKMFSTTEIHAKWQQNSVFLMNELTASKLLLQSGYVGEFDLSLLISF